MLELLIDKFLTEKNLEKLAASIDQYLATFELETGELKPIITAVTAGNKVMLNVITLKQYDNAVLYSRTLKSIELKDAIFEIKKATKNQKNNS